VGADGGFMDLAQYDWNRPSQKRGWDKVRKLVDAARSLIVEKRTLDLKMTEIAKRADVPVGSLYQFFPSKSSLIRYIFEYDMHPIEEKLLNNLNELESVEDFFGSISENMKLALEFIEQNEFLVAIWSVTIADIVIYNTHLAVSAENAKLIATRLIEISGASEKEDEIRTGCHMITQLWGVVLRLCLLAESKEEADRLREGFASMVTGHFKQILDF
jgi:AcrR family transcriptional regulator